MAVEALEVRRPVRNDGVQLRARRSGAGERRVQPAATDNPVAIGVRVGVPADRGLDLVERPDAEEVEPVERDGARSQMHVGIVERRHHGRAPSVDHLRHRSAMRQDRLVAADLDDPVAADRDGGRPPEASARVPGGPEAKTRPLKTIRSASGIDREGSRAPTDGRE